MRAPPHAPAVRYPHVRPPAVGWALAIVSASGLAGMVAWLALGAAHSDMAIKTVAGLGLWLACAAAAWRWWRHVPTGHLAWDGGQWWLECGALGPSPMQGCPHIHLDLQACLLLSAQPLQGRMSWLWLDRRSDPVQWAALRRAVYSPARNTAPDGGATTKT